MRDKDGIIIANQDTISELAMNNPSIHSCMMYWKEGEVGYEKALEMCVIALERELRETKERLIRHVEHSMTSRGKEPQDE